MVIIFFRKRAYNYNLDPDQGLPLRDYKINLTQECRNFIMIDSKIFSDNDKIKSVNNDFSKPFFIGVSPSFNALNKDFVGSNTNIMYLDTETDLPLLTLTSDSTRSA